MTHDSAPHIPTCSICHKPVNLETAKIDENGFAVHEDCYVPKIIEKLATVPRPTES